MSPATRRALQSSLGWRLSGHARTAARARGFAVADVLLACVDPQQTYPTLNHGPGREVRQRGHIAVAVDPHSKTVITVLLRSQQHWTDTDARCANHESANTTSEAEDELPGERPAMGLEP
jgi:hypothetical protein